MAQILLFNIGAEKRRKILVLALKLGAACREIPPEDHGQTIGALTGRAGFDESETDAEPFSDEMLVLDGLSRAQLDALLTGLRRERAAVALKAVVTEHNLGWTPRALCRELAAEHAAMHGGGKSVHEEK
ncbi:MAG: DUF3783 domain-containing protein [Oscillospiraceae bacterium]|nr:DUF3783 domain-containing protein [Oscillospiraceae bacterium]